MNKIELPDNLTPNQIWKDFCSLVRGHENLYQCLMKIKDFILNHPVLIVYYIFIMYYIKNM